VPVSVINVKAPAFSRASSALHVQARANAIPVKAAATATGARATANVINALLRYRLNQTALLLLQLIALCDHSDSITNISVV
jgi:hypothetical protein